MKIAFLTYNMYGIGGTIRATANLSGALAAAGHEVEIASVYQSQDDPRLTLSPDVRVRPLIDWRRTAPTYEGEEPANAEPSVMFPDQGVLHGPLAPSALTDQRVRAYLRETDADVVIGTRPVLNGYLARFGESRYLRVGQEHLTLTMHDEQLRADQNAALAELDAFVTVSEADAAAYRQALPDVATRILCIPNAVPAAAVSRSDLNSRTIVAAGRLTGIKRYDRLIDAFAKLAPEYPDWNLRLYGRGPQRAALRAQIDDLGLYGQVRLMGAVAPIETEWAKGAIAAVTSDGESFGMTIVEAMHCGVPVVATDCPYGPGEIISHGVDGLLVPLEGEAEAFADVLRTLMDDDERRRTMGAAAERKAARYAPELIAARYVELAAELHAARKRTRSLSSRLRDAFRVGRPGAASPAAAPEPPAAGPRGARASCAATPDSGLIVRLATEGLPGKPLDLRLRLRKDPRQREIRVPLPSLAEAEDGRLDVHVSRDAHTLAEGRWDLHVIPRNGGRSRRIAAELVEQAALLTLPLRSDEAGVSAWVPYTTLDGNLSLRTWLRPAHAEVHDIYVGERGAHVTAELHGTVTLGPDAAVLAVSRGEQGSDLRFPVEALPRDRFTFTAHYAKLLDARDPEEPLWDLWLHPDDPSAAAGPVPLGRIAGDSHDRKKTDTFPPRFLPAEGGHPLSRADADAAAAVRVVSAAEGAGSTAADADRAANSDASAGAGSGGVVRVRPYLTVNNALALSARPHQVEPPEPESNPESATAPEAALPSEAAPEPEAAAESAPDAGHVPARLDG